VTRTANYDREEIVLDYTLMRSMHDKIYNQGVYLNLPVEDRKIFVDREGERAIITIDYSMPIDLFVYKFDMKFHIDRKSEGIGFK
jgi:hypothetical protein